MNQEEHTILIDRESSSEPSKFKTKNWVEIHDESRRTYDSNRSRIIK